MCVTVLYNITTTLFKVTNELGDNNKRILQYIISNDVIKKRREAINGKDPDEEEAKSYLFGKEGQKATNFKSKIDNYSNYNYKKPREVHHKPTMITDMYNFSEELVRKLNHFDIEFNNDYIEDSNIDTQNLMVDKEKKIIRERFLIQNLILILMKNLNKVNYCQSKSSQRYPHLMNKN